MTSLRTPAAALLPGLPTYSQTFPCRPSTAEIGRNLVRDVLGVWHLDSLADRAALIVTELIANAYRHTSCSEICLTVAQPEAVRVRVGVVDREPARLPILSRAADDDESGRGLLLVDAVADRWGYDLCGSGRRSWGKEVWAELRTGGGE
ncbi:ATP-binding protein [Streptomyces chrestomyceticus]|uniref:ATP-binding protein n=1 Tax=Streptomyces chrestomyceticus TaxID=68185 RepID=UPI0033CB5799